jgi:hypothetical protein
MSSENLLCKYTPSEKDSAFVAFNWGLDGPIRYLPAGHWCVVPPNVKDSVKSFLGRGGYWPEFATRFEFKEGP